MKNQNTIASEWANYTTNGLLQRIEIAKTGLRMIAFGYVTINESTPSYNRPEYLEQLIGELTAEIARREGA